MDGIAQMVHAGVAKEIMRQASERKTLAEMREEDNEARINRQLRARIEAAEEKNEEDERDDRFAIGVSFTGGEGSILSCRWSMSEAQVTQVMADMSTWLRDRKAGR